MESASDIRLATAEDLPALLQLYRHLSPEDPVLSLEDATAIFAQLSASPGNAVLVLEHAGQLIASCVVIITPNLSRGGRPFALIENVVTHSDFRNQGFGKQILDAACARAWEAGCYKVMLMTGSKRPETLGFYTSAGFKQNKTGFQKRNL